jgi:hypothetical protein
MKIKNSHLQQQAHCSTPQVRTPSLLKDVKTLFNKAIKNSLSTSLGKKCSLADTCRNFRKFFNDFTPH